MGCGRLNRGVIIWQVLAACQFFFGRFRNRAYIGVVRRPFVDAAYGCAPHAAGPCKPWS